MSLAPGFLTVDNMKVVIDVVVGDLRDMGRPYVEHMTLVPVKPLIYDIMRDMYGDAALFGHLGIDDLNQLVRQAAVRVYVEGIQAKQPGAGDLAAPQPEPNVALVGAGEFEFDQSGRQPPFDGDSADNSANNAANKEPGALQELAKRVDPEPLRRYVRCISVDSADRDVERYPSRYTFATNLAETVKNVVAISLVNVVAPSETSTLNTPYILVTVDELQGLYAYNSSNPVARAFSKLVPSGCFKSSKGREYTVFEPACDDGVSFDVPMASLSRLTVSLVAPSGAPVGAVAEVFRIVKLTRDANGSWFLFANDSWKEGLFGEGDAVTMSGFSTGFPVLDDFLNRTEGHVVTGAGAPDDTGRSNMFVIEPPLEFDAGLQVYKTPAAFDPVFVGVGGCPPGTICIDGALMNRSSQVSLTFRAVCLSRFAPSLD